MQPFPAGASMLVPVSIGVRPGERIGQFSSANALDHFRVDHRVRDIAGAGSKVTTYDNLVKEGALVGDGTIREASEARFALKPRH